MNCGAFRRQAFCWDRGLGRAPQAHAGEDGKDIGITLRQIVEERR